MTHEPRNPGSFQHFWLFFLVPCSQTSHYCFSLPPACWLLLVTSPALLTLLTIYCFYYATQCFKHLSNENLSMNKITAELFGLLWMGTLALFLLSSCLAPRRLLVYLSPLLLLSLSQQYYLLIEKNFFGNSSKIFY